MKKVLHVTVLVVILLSFVGLQFSGCGGSGSVPSGWVQLCSRSSRAYGDVYVDGRYRGYLHPYSCMTVAGLTFGQWHTIEIAHATAYETYHCRIDFLFDEVGEILDCE